MPTEGIAAGGVILEVIIGEKDQQGRNFVEVPRYVYIGKSLGKSMNHPQRCLYDLHLADGTGRIPEC